MLFIAICEHSGRAAISFSLQTLHRSRPHVEQQAQRVHDFDNGGEAGLPCSPRAL